MPPPGDSVARYKTPPLFLHARLIDDAVQLWDFSKVSREFKRDFCDIMKQELKFGSLTWKVEKPSKSIDFLDLTIQLEGNGTVNTKTYIKPLCLHLYIPPRSAHPKGVIKSLIFGTLRRFWIQNSRLEDFESHVTDRKSVV